MGRSSVAIASTHVLLRSFDITRNEANLCWQCLKERTSSRRKVDVEILETVVELLMMARIIVQDSKLSSPTRTIAVGINTNV